MSQNNGEALTHEDVELRYDDYDEGTLPPHERARVDAHLAGCGVCAALYRDLGATAAALGALKSSAPTTIGTAIEQSLHDRSGGRFFSARADGPLARWFFGGPGLIVALVIMLAIAALVYWLSASPTGTLAPPRRAPAVAPAERIVPAAQD
ncbi:MAG: zf-HC2 domain-containing protein [Myxococcales bacterium]|nr:zf-HC2 domain-containing protein [Myxococcales bacterium]